LSWDTRREEGSGLRPPDSSSSSQILDCTKICFKRSVKDDKVQNTNITHFREGKKLPELEFKNVNKRLSTRSNIDSFFPSRIPDPRSKRFWIPDPDPH
jgi:hypothetical protein